MEEKPPFHDAFRRRRPIFPGDGFFEWAGRGANAKLPYFFRMRDDRPFGFAELWERWERGGEVINSCTILTTEANDLLRPYPAEEMCSHPVSNLVNSPRNQGAGLIEEVPLNSD